MRSRYSARIDDYDYNGEPIPHTQLVMFLEADSRTSVSDISIFLFLYLCLFLEWSHLCLQRQHMPGVSCLGIDCILGWIWFSVWGWIPVCLGCFLLLFTLVECDIFRIYLIFLSFSPFLHFPSTLIC